MTEARTRDLALRAWARVLVDHEPRTAPINVVTSVAHNVGNAIGDCLIEGSAVDLGAHPDPPGGWANPWLPGIVHEQAVSAEARSARGAWYTPRSVVDGLAMLAMDPLPGFVADPTCGGGAFLLAALDRFVALGLSARDALARIGGMDIDRGAAQVSGWSVLLWAAVHGVSVGVDDAGIVVGDALTGHPDWWPAQRLTLGNPPFATPLRKGPVPAEVAAFRESHHEFFGPYTDLAALHLLAAVEQSDPGSTVTLVQPQSVLSGRDTRVLRAHLDQVAPVRALWAAREPVFDAGVRACAVVLGVGSDGSDPVVLAAGADVSTVETVNGSRRSSGGSGWSMLAARALGAPALPSMVQTAEGAVSQGCSGTLGDLVTATAGFRDEYYGLVGACREGADYVDDADVDDAEGQANRPGTNRLVTVGAVEPLATLWGIETTTFGRKQWLRPVIDLDALDSRVLAWTERQLVPKIVLATQSRILEPVIDRTGSLIPATPLLAVHTEPEHLNKVAAVLLAPPVVAWAWQHWFGAAMAVDALKLAASQVLELPLPANHAAWEEAAELIGANEDPDPASSWQRACAVARVMNVAYGAAPDVFEWWLNRSRRPPPVDPRDV